MRHCPKCFTELPEKANYCPICGECMKSLTIHEMSVCGGPVKKVVAGYSDSALWIGKEITEGEDYSE